MHDDVHQQSTHTCSALLVDGPATTGAHPSAVLHAVGHVWLGRNGALVVWLLIQLPLLGSDRCSGAT